MEQRRSGPGIGVNEPSAVCYPMFRIVLQLLACLGV